MSKVSISIVLSLQFFLCAPAAFSLSPELTAEESQVETLTNQIFRKEVDLERYYLQYRKIGTATPKFRRLRYFAFQVASTSCAMASNILFTDVGRKGLKDSNINDFGRGDGDIGQTSGGGTSTGRPSSADNTKGEVRQALNLALIASILGPGSSLLELCSNGYTTLKNIKTGNNPASAVKAVESRLKEIDDLLAQRKKILDEHPELRALAINRAEHTVLECFRDWCLSEFVDLYAEVKSGQAGANVFYMLDVAAGGCAVAGNVIALRSLNPGRDKLAGPAANVSIVGDSINVINAPASSYAGKRIGQFWRNRLRKRLSDHLHYGEAESKAAMAQLRAITNAADDRALEAASSIQSRIAAYLMWSERYDAIMDKQIAELRHRSKVAAQGKRVGPLIGATGLVQDIAAATAFYGYPGDERKGASLGYAGSITALSGNGLALLYTNGNFVGELIHRKKLRQQRLLPEQLLDERIRLLHLVDQMVVSK